MTGNLFVSNPNAPQNDPRMQTVKFTRDNAQNEMIGLSPDTESIIKPLGSFNENYLDITNEIVQFRNPCPNINCKSMCETNMKVTGNSLLSY